MSEGLRPWYDHGLCHILRSETQSPRSEVVLPRQDVERDVAASSEPEMICPAESVTTPETELVRQPHDAVWERLFMEKTAPCKAVFTYWELGQDLCGQPSSERKRFLQQLMLSLRQPRGSIGFWPMAILVGQELQANVAWFCRGVAQMQARTVICFGETAGAFLQRNAALLAETSHGSFPDQYNFLALEELSLLPGQQFLTQYVRLLQALHIELP